MKEPLRELLQPVRRLQGLESSAEVEVAAWLRVLELLEIAAREHLPRGVPTKEAKRSPPVCVGRVEQCQVRGQLAASELDGAATITGADVVELATPDPCP